MAPGGQGDMEQGREVVTVAVVYVIFNINTQILEKHFLN